MAFLWVIEMSKHTAGPWMIREVTHSNAPGQTAYAIDFNEDQEHVVDLVYEKADAILISAAPDLLEALEAILPFIPVTTASEGGAAKYSENVRAADMVRAAIYKARGEA